MSCWESDRVHVQRLDSARNYRGGSARKKIGMGIVSKECLQESIAGTGQSAEKKKESSLRWLNRQREFASPDFSRCQMSAFGN